MLLWIIQITIISIVLILLVHNLIHFFKSNLTVPKIKDLVNISNQKYETMYNIINQHSNNNRVMNTTITETNTNNNNDYTLIDLLPKNEPTMKNELKQFLKSQLQNNENLL